MLDGKMLQEKRREGGVWHCSLSRWLVGEGVRNYLWRSRRSSYRDGEQSAVLTSMPGFSKKLSVLHWVRKSLWDLESSLYSAWRWYRVCTWWQAAESILCLEEEAWYSGWLSLQLAELGSKSCVFLAAKVTHSSQDFLWNSLTVEWAGKDDLSDWERCLGLSSVLFFWRVICLFIYGCARS